MKNEELNLAELLKDCPKGTKFYTPICGEVEFVTVAINHSDYPIITRDSDDIKQIFTEKGCYVYSRFAECVLFPSKEQRDWNVWKAEQKKKHQYQVGDYIIFKGNDNLNPLVYKILDIDNTFYEIEAISDPKEYTQSLSLFDPILENSIKVNQFDPKWLKPFNRVLVRDKNMFQWRISYFNSLEDTAPFFNSINGTYYQCIPYNLETKHLVGTTEKAPEFYINWEE